MKIKVPEELKKDLMESAEIVVRFAADVAVSFVMLFLITKSALFSHLMLERLTATTHDPMTSFMLSAAHAVALGFHVAAFTWVSFKSVKRFLKSLK